MYILMHSVGEHAVRLFLVLDPSSKEALEERIYCYFWIEQEKHPYFITGSIVPDTPFSIRVIHKTTYYQMLLTCNVPSFLKDRVTHVSFSAEPCIDVQVYLPVTYPKNTGQFLHQFGQCNANGILFGYVSDKEARFMVEWIEMGLAFGIGEFNLYNGTMQTSAAFRRVLDYYVGKGILRIYHQIPPISGIDPNNRESVEFAMRTGFHDCMYRNMYRYEYIVYTDLDEIIVPKEPYTSYGEIIKRLSSDKPIAQVVFPSLAFFQIILQESQQVISRWNLTVTNYVKSVLTGTQPKTFINPRMCIRGYSHACSIMSQNSTLQLGVNYGQVNHYRNMCLKKGIFRITPETCKKYLRSISENKLIAKFVTQTFYDRVKSVQRILKI